MNSRFAFTLVEVLVSMMIVLILSGLLFTVGSQSIRRAHEVVCLLNMKQIHSAVLLYEADYGEYPENNVRDSAFVPYLANQVPHCFARDPKNGYLFDYIIYIPTKNDSSKVKLAE